MNQAIGVMIQSQIHASPAIAAAAKMTHTCERVERPSHILSASKKCHAINTTATKIIAFMLGIVAHLRHWASMNLGDDIEDVWSKFIERLSDESEKYNDARKAIKGYQQLEQLPFENKVVPLNKAIMAMQVMSGRIAFHTFPNVLRDIGIRSVKSVGELVTQAGGKAALGKASPRASLLSILRQIADGFFESKRQAAIEAKIRKASLDIRRELIDLAMKPREGEIRVTAEVSSRHRSHLQRRKNKSWRSPT